MSTAVVESAPGRPAADVRRRRRVLFLADHLGFAGGGVHGVTTYLLDVLPSLAAAGVDAAACFLREPHPAADVLRAHGLSVRFLGTRRFDPFVAAQVGKMVQRGGYEIVHCTQFRASIIGRALARARGGPQAVLHIHDMKEPPWPVRALNRAVADPADLGLCVSRAAREIAVRGYHISPERVRVLHTGIDTSAFGPLSSHERERMRRDLGVAPDAPALCLVGRFYAVKGHDVMIRMHADVVARRPDCVLLLVGDGPERPACERLAARLGLARHVRFLGHRDDVARVVAAADVAVVPSRSEGLSRAAVEANLCGVPAVAFDIGGLAEALPDPECGRLVPAGDRAAFVDAVDDVLQQRGDAAAADARMRAARARFGLLEHVQALRACYDTLES